MSLYIKSNIFKFPPSQSNIILFYLFFFTQNASSFWPFKSSLFSGVVLLCDLNPRRQGYSLQFQTTQTIIGNA